MTSDVFKTGIARLRTRFGEKAFDQEFCVSLWNMIEDGDNDWFTKTVDVFTLERKHSHPPLGVDFREAFHKDAKNQLAVQVKKTAELFHSHGYQSDQLQKIFKDLGVSSVWEAVEHVKKNGPLDLEKY